MTRRRSSMRSVASSARGYRRHGRGGPARRDPIHRETVVDVMPIGCVVEIGLGRAQLRLAGPPLECRVDVLRLGLAQLIGLGHCEHH